MEGYKVIGDDRTSAVLSTARKFHQFYFVKLYQNKDLNEGFEDARFLHQRELNEQIRETQRHLDTLRRKRDDSYGSLCSIKYNAECRLSSYDKQKSCVENNLRSLRGALKLMSLKSPYRTLHHGTTSLVGEKERIKKIKQEIADEQIAEKERIAEKEMVYQYRGYKPKPERSYSLEELKEQIKV